MENKIEVNTDAMGQDARILEEYITKLKKDMASMDGMIAELNGMWEGEAKKLFLANLLQEQGRMKELLEDAEKIVSKMKEAIRLYQACESSVAQEIDAIRI